MPSPWLAETASGSPNPSPWNSAVTLKSLGLSALLTATTTGMLAAAQGPGQLGVADPQAGAAVDDHQHRVGLGDRQPRLALHVARQLGLVLEVDAAGVDEVEGDPVPLAGRAACGRG